MLRNSENFLLGKLEVWHANSYAFIEFTFSELKR